MKPDNVQCRNCVFSLLVTEGHAPCNDCVAYNKFVEYVDISGWDKDAN